MKAMNINEEVSALPKNLFQNHYVLVFDLTSLQDAGKNIRYPELSGEIFQIEKFFRLPAKKRDSINCYRRECPLLKLISSQRLLKMSEVFCGTFFLYFSNFYGFYIIAF